MNLCFSGNYFPLKPGPSDRAPGCILQEPSPGSSSGNPSVQTQTMPLSHMVKATSLRSFRKGVEALPGHFLLLGFSTAAYSAYFCDFPYEFLIESPQEEPLSM